MRLIYCGDVVGRAGREAVLNNIADIREKYAPDVFIMNVENAAHGFGVTPGICREFLEKGVDALVTGNHVWQQRELIPFLNDCKQIIRPLNYPETLPGRGALEITLANGKKILIVQLLGRLFMEAVDCPVQAIDKLLKSYTLGKNIDAVFVDIHAEATSEKLAMGYYLDGKVSVVAGTHTHVPTADYRLLRQGTAYITDVGMCGDYDSVLGFEIDEPINRLARKYSGGRLTVSKGKGTLYGIIVDIDDTGRALSIEQLVIQP
ncbi:MAG: TIGR00282 family metallophosphoesterase [Pseudomonadota bacterium]|nr:TIGR00282 family metallophosphoesterase [Pseudomonadota bacterium]